MKHSGGAVLVIVGVAVLFGVQLLTVLAAGELRRGARGLAYVGAALSFVGLVLVVDATW